MRIIELLSPIQGKLQFVPGMIRSPDLAPLRRFANDGKIPVNVYGFSVSASGRIFWFYPTAVPQVKRCALEKFFDPETVKRIASFRELFSL